MLATTTTLFWPAAERNDQYSPNTTGRNRRNASELNNMAIYITTTVESRVTQQSTPSTCVAHSGLAFFTITTTAALSALAREKGIAQRHGKSNHHHKQQYTTQQIHITAQITTYVRYATSHATTHCIITTATAYRVPNSRCMDAMAATHGV